MSLKTVAGMLYKIAASGVLDTGHYKITIITELCVDSKKCNQGVIIDNYSVVIHTNRAAIEGLLTSIRKLIERI